MPFRFPFETLGRFRQMVERQRELELRQALAEMAASRHQLEAIHEQMAAIAGEEMQDLQSGTTAAQLQFDVMRRAVLASRELELDLELTRIEELCRQRRQAFQHARQEREAVDVLRRRQLELYLRQEARNQQRQLDDQFLMRREYLRRH